MARAPRVNLGGIAYHGDKKVPDPCSPADDQERQKKVPDPFSPVVYLEAIRDIVASGVPVGTEPRQRARTTAHEIVHQFGLAGHNDDTYNLRSSGTYQNPIGQDYLILEDIAFLRQKIHSPGDDAQLNATSVGLQPTDPSSVVEAVPAELVSSAVNYWASTGLDESVLGALRSVTVYVGDFSGTLLGVASGAEIILDADAAGHGWFVDATPLDSVEFIDVAGEWVARAGTEADGRIDMLTVLVHEFGHLLALDHTDDGVMDDTLSVGSRLLPELESDLAILTEVVPMV